MREVMSANSHPTTGVTRHAGRTPDFKNARFCRARVVPAHRVIVQSPQGLEVNGSGHRTSTGRGGRVARPARRAHIENMRLPLLAPALFLALIGAAGAAVAQGHPPGTTPPAFQPPLTVPAPSAIPPGGTSAGARYPNTESLSRDRVQSQGYKVQRLEQRNDGSWKAETSRDAVPTRPQGTPGKVIVRPDGGIVEKKE